MSNIDKRDIHNQQLKAFITGFLTDPAHDNQSPRSMTAEVFRIALASLEADPVAWRSLYYENHGLLIDSKNVLASWQKQGWECEPLYTAPPAPISDSLLSDLLTIAKTAANAADECAHAEFGDDSMEHSAAIADWERRAAMLQGADGNTQVIPDCTCRTCCPVTFSDSRFVVCPDCGNKRCPHANDHRHACTGSNESGQEGSAYPAAPQQEVK